MSNKLRIGYYGSNRDLFPTSPDVIAANMDVMEQIVKEMKGRGHEITVYASKGSAMEGVTIIDLDLPPHKLDVAYNHENVVQELHIAYRIAYISELIKNSANFDIIHLHVGRAIYGEPFLAFAKCPVVFTVHEHLEKPFEPLMNLYAQTANLVSISDSQRQAMPGLNYVETIYHGVEIENFPFIEQPSDAFLFLSRVSKEKGVEFAIQAANQTNIMLDIHGPGEAAYIAKAITPHMSDRIRYHGLIRKHSQEWYDAYGKAKALIVPIQWDEPFGLVMIEAMACGTPIIAFNRGSVPELVIDGVTGFLCEPNDVDGMAKAMQRMQDMSQEEYLQMRRQCRQHIEKNFTVKKMADQYESLYEKLIASYKS